MDKPEAEKTSVSVKIFNETYRLKTSAPEEKVVEIAAIVDGRMNRLAEKRHILSGGKLAVWAALDLAAELDDVQAKYGEMAGSWKKLQDEHARLSAEHEALQSVYVRTSARCEDISKKYEELKVSYEKIIERYERLLAVAREL